MVGDGEEGGEMERIEDKSTRERYRPTPQPNPSRGGPRPLTGVVVVDDCVPSR
jgi:hypothetical protein